MPWMYHPWQKDRNWGILVHGLETQPEKRVHDGYLNTYNSRVSGRALSKYMFRRVWICSYFKYFFGDLLLSQSSPPSLQICCDLLCIVVHSCGCCWWRSPSLVPWWSNRGNRNVIQHQCNTKYEDDNKKWCDGRPQSMHARSAGRNNYLHLVSSTFPLHSEI